MSANSYVITNKQAHRASDICSAGVSELGLFLINWVAAIFAAFPITLIQVLLQLLQTFLSDLAAGFPCPFNTPLFLAGSLSWFCNSKEFW